MTSLDATVELLQLFGDGTRVRLLALLAHEELTVAEIVRVTELAQSRVSTHLGKLREAGLLRDWRAGASTFYALDASMPDEARKLWELLRAQLGDGVLERDRAKADAIVRARDTARWPDRIAGEMERHYSPGRTWEATARAFLGLARLGDVLDVGCGDGALAELVAPRARSLTAVDVSERMVDAARARLTPLANVEIARADMHELPFRARSFDAVLLFNVLTYGDPPSRVVAEASRVLRPGGGLVLVTLGAHDHADVTATYGHLHAGFAPATVKKLLTSAGLTVETCGVTSRERRPPYFEIVTAFCQKREKGN